MSISSSDIHSDAVSRLAHLLKQKKLNALLYEKKTIPAYMYEQTNAVLADKIDDLERRCYTC